MCMNESYHTYARTFVSMCSGVCVHTWSVGVSYKLSLLWAGKKTSCHKFTTRTLATSRTDSNQARLRMVFHARHLCQMTMTWLRRATRCSRTCGTDLRLNLYLLYQQRKPGNAATRTGRGTPQSLASWLASHYFRL